MMLFPQYFLTVLHIAQKSQPQREKPLIQIHQQKKRGGGSIQKQTLAQQELNDAESTLDVANIPVTSEEDWFATLHKNPSAVPVPNSMWATVQNEDSTVFIKVSKDIKVEKSIVFPKRSEATPTIAFNGHKIDLDLETKILNISDVTKVLAEIENYQVCPGAIDGQRSFRCQGYCPYLPNGKPGKRCPNCVKKRHSWKKMERSRERSQQKTKAKTKKLQRERRAFSKKVEKLEKKLETMMDQFDKLKESQIKDIIATLPPRQQHAVQACIAAPRAKSPCGRRYTQQWMYECMLMRIKSCGLYRKLIRDQTLALPSLRTLQRYMKKLKPAYGFIPATFEMLAKKSNEMDESEKHGVLLIDEMSLTTYLSFNKSSLKVDGFVNLGNHTPENLKDQPGDHALVFMFKPFKGQWFQTVAAFLSKGAVDGSTLSKLTLEATALIEQAGFMVDMWVCDGAPWNRAMWAEMGIKNPFTKSAKKKKGTKKRNNGEDDENEIPRVGCIHPCDSTRMLFMCSDFPHLIKRMKARILPNEKGIARDLKTPDGVVKFSHWVAAYEADKDNLIQVCPKLTRDHLYPQNYQTMNVGMSFTFFSKGVADTMEHFRDEGVPGLQECDATVKFIRRVNDLIDAMNANSPRTSIRKKETASETSEKHNDENSENDSGDDDDPNAPAGGKKSCFKDQKDARVIINKFLDYIKEWHEIPGRQEEKLPHQTQFGLYVTLNSALQVSDYLIEKVGFQYGMTARMNQDALEHFFGAVRQACGCNSHPDPLQFIQIYRLLSVASLVKPPRGSNVTGAEMLQALLNTSDLLSEKEKERQVEFERELDDLLDQGEPVDALELLFDESYNAEKYIDEKALRMFCGYVARKARRSTVAKKCDNCFDKLQANKSAKSPLDSLIERRSEGYLLKPSDELYKIVFDLEDVICRTLHSTQFHDNILYEVLENAKIYTYDEVGCEEHKRELSRNIIRFYLTTRMIFACKNFNKKKNEDADKRNRIKSLIKTYQVMSSRK